MEYLEKFFLRMFSCIQTASHLFWGRRDIEKGGCALFAARKAACSEAQASRSASSLCFWHILDRNLYIRQREHESEWERLQLAIAQPLETLDFFMSFLYNI